MTSIGVEWNENRTGNPDAEQLLSWDNNTEFYTATKKALPWRAGASTDPGRSIVPACYIERLFAKAPVQDPSTLEPDPFLCKCLGLEEYIAPALELLIDQGLLEDTDDEAPTARRTRMNGCSDFLCGRKQLPAEADEDRRGERAR